MAKVKGFAPWRITKGSLPLVQDIEKVLEEYRPYLPLTVRQVFYRLGRQLRVPQERRLLQGRTGQVQPWTPVGTHPLFLDPRRWNFLARRA
jgi:hypothetical protein